MQQNKQSAPPPPPASSPGSASNLDSFFKRLGQGQSSRLWAGPGRSGAVPGSLRTSRLNPRDEGDLPRSAATEAATATADETLPGKGVEGAGAGGIATGIGELNFFRGKQHAEAEKCCITESGVFPRRLLEAPPCQIKGAVDTFVTGLDRLTPKAESRTYRDTSCLCRGSPMPRGCCSGGNFASFRLVCSGFGDGGNDMQAGSGRTSTHINMSEKRVVR